MKNIFEVYLFRTIFLLAIFSTAACNRFSTKDYNLSDNFGSSVPPEVICTSAHLRWNRNTEAAKGFAGYKVYYGEKSQQMEAYPHVLDIGPIPADPANPLSQADAFYRVLNLNSNTTYYFAVSAYTIGYDANGNYGVFEGEKSNEASGHIPACGELSAAVIKVK